MARLKKRERIHQIARWLEEKYPVIYPVKVRIERIPNPDSQSCIMGEAILYASPPTFVVRLHAPQTRREMVDTLIHEWAHLRLHRPESHVKKMKLPEHGHDDPFHLECGRMWSDFHDESGWKESREF